MDKLLQERSIHRVQNVSRAQDPGEALKESRNFVDPCSPMMATGRYYGLQDDHTITSVGGPSQHIAGII